LRTYDEFEVSTINEIESDSFLHEGERILMTDFLKNFQLVQFSRTISYGFKMQQTIDKLNRLGIASVLDIDDYWNFDRRHLLYDAHIKDQVSLKTIKSLNLTDHVTTTTDYFADKIRLYNPNVTVLSNAIDPSQEQFRIKKNTSYKVRIGWLGSHCHIEDIVSLNQSMIALHKDKSLINRYQLKLGAFNGNSVSLFFEQVFTNNYDLLKDYPYYTGYLKQNVQTANDTYIDMPYKRMWFTDVYNYANYYNDIDISLAPLTNITFNHCKSQLKLIEAGFMKKALICSKVMPYTIDGINNKNCVMIKDKRDMDWYLNIKRLINNPTLIDDLGEALYETVKEKYHIATVTKQRAELYKYLIDNK
jgi:glycosyltransferase involved in cell wall biosynthesis